MINSMVTTDSSPFQGPGDANGYLGLAPYTGTDSNMLEINFMQGLLKNNVID